MAVGQNSQGRTTTSSPFVLPVLKRDFLLNGLQLVTLEQQGSGTVAVHLRINSGALFDLANRGGMADLTAGMLLKGGGGLNAKNIADTVETSGLSVRVSVDWDATSIVMSGPSDSTETIFDLLNRLVVTPAFDQKEFDDLKASRIAALKQEANEATEVRARALDAVYGAHPFGRFMRGSVESLPRITRPDLLFYHGRYYVANNSTIIVSGDATAEQVTRLGRTKLGAWKKAEKFTPSFRAPEFPTARKIVVVDRPELSSAYAAICQPGFSRRDENYFAARIMMDLLSQAVSKQAGSPGAVLELSSAPQVIAGPVMVVMKEEGEKLPALVDSVLQAMTMLQRNPVPADQVEAAKARLLSAMTDRLKTTQGTAEVILDIETYGLGKDYLINFADRLAAVAPADVQAAAQSLLRPQSVAVAVCGPAAKMDGPLKKLASVADAR
jgi:zinc protease